MITFKVHGVAQPAGSKKAFVPTNKHTGQPFRRKGGGIVVNVTDDNSKSKGWKQEVAWAARQAYDGPLLAGPIRMTIAFYRVRPKGHFTPKGAQSKKGQETPFPISKPDLLKLTRGVEDALTKVIWADDAQVVDHRLTKHWGESAYIEVLIEPIEVMNIEVPKAKKPRTKPEPKPF